MATKAPTITHNHDHTVMYVLWENLTGGDDGTAIELPTHADKCVQAVGTFDTTTVPMEGSNLPAPAAVDANYFALTYNGANAAEFANAAGGHQLYENPRWVRPHVTADGGSGDVDVYMVVRRPTDARQ